MASGQTNLSDATTFELVVRECVRPQLGTLVLPAGGTGTLPIYLYTTEVLTNIAMTVTGSSFGARGILSA